MINYNPFSLEGKVILVTGASSGIGKAIAIECTKMGANVIITARNTERLNDTFLQLQGDCNKKIIADLNNQDDIDNLLNQLPILNGLVHCAGLTKTLPFSFVNEEALSSVMNVNFVTPVLMSAKLVKKKKISKGASIVFISSISGVYCSATSASIYSASKGAVNGIVKGMALDLASKQIRVNCVNPGMIDTNIFDAGTITKEQLEEDKRNYPLKRYGKPEEVAYAAIYLLSDASKWVTGSNLLIDGGFTLK